MNSRRTSNTNNTNHFLIASIIFVVAILIWLFFPTPIRYVSELLFGPMLKTESTLKGLLPEKSVDYELSLQEELTYLRSENESLRQQLSDSGEERIAAGVIGRPTALPYDVLVIDQGSNDGVIEGAPVFADQYHVIGFVAAVYQNSSVVALVTTPGFTSTVFVFGPNIYTTAAGLGGGAMRIHVPQGIDLHEGNIVAVPSLSPGIFGTITVIDSVPSRPEQYGYVTSDIAVNSLRYVSVGTRPVSNISFEEARTVIETTKREFLNIDMPEGVLIEVDSDQSTSTATSTATSTSEVTTESGD